MPRKNINIHEQILRFRLIVFTFFICLTLPLVMIVYYGYQKFENDMLFQYRWKSSDALVQINKTLNQRLLNEQKRSPLEYFFDHSMHFDKHNNVKPRVSPLSFPKAPHYLTDLFGLIGYFTIINNEILKSPLLPYTSQNENIAANVQLSTSDIHKRVSRIQFIKEILIKNQLLKTTGIVNNLKENSKVSNKLKLITQETNFKLIKTANQKFIFYRNIHFNQKPALQGFIVEKEVFLSQLLSIFIKRARYDNSVQVQFIDKKNEKNNLFYHYKIKKNGDAKVGISHTINDNLLSYALFQGDLTFPFSDMRLYFSTDSLPLGPASSFVFLFIVVLSFVIISASIGFYWLGIKQIKLEEQRMNFVSSVSHELKTPMTSILMYSEMLKSGMVQDQKNQSDYHHFIFDESERLSRLINNVLQLSNLSQNQKVMSLEYMGINVLKDIIQSKVSTLINKNNFQLHFIFDKRLSADTQVLIDLDAFAQIVINLVDNAVKFYNAAKINDIQRQKIDITFTVNHSSNKKINFSIRDHGPGISKSQHNKIFELFYRCGNEMTRTTSGTGIGLALVHQLVVAQSGEISVSRKQQGVSFDLVFIARQL